MSAARVLVVDDDPWILRMVTATLQKKNYVVDTAQDGQQALQRAQAAPPDVVVTDIMMPVMDGWAFVQQLRTIPHLAHTPVIFLTALGRDEARLRQLGIREEDHLSKPFRFDELEKRVNAALARTPAAPGSMPTPGSQPGAPMPPQGYPPQAYPPQAYPPQAYPPQAYPPQGYPPQGYPPQGYPPQAYPPQAYPPQGYPPQGYPPQGYPAGPPPQQPPQQAPQPQAPPQAPAAPSADDKGAASASTSGRRRRTTALNGKLEQLGLSSLLVMMEMERKDGVLALSDGNSEQSGRIFLRGGQVIHASIDQDGDLPGKDSVYRMLAWTHGTFSFAAMEVDMEDTVKSSTTHLLMEGARLIDEANR